MGTGQVDTSVDQRRRSAPEGWPDLIYTRAFLLFENDQWYAMATRFNIVAVGPSPAVAWREMQELTCDYLSMCAEDGLPFDQIVRPMPLRRQAGLYLRWAAGSILRPFGGTHRAREHELVVPSLNGQYAHC